MSKKKDRITKGLKEVGAAWAVRNDRYICTNHQCCNYLGGDRRAYHIHPDASYPHEARIMKFYNLDEVASYIKEAHKVVDECEHPQGERCFSEDGLIEWCGQCGELICDHHMKKFGQPHPNL